MKKKNYKLRVIQGNSYSIIADGVIFGDTKISLYLNKMLIAVFPTAMTVIEEITETPEE